MQPPRFVDSIASTHCIASVAFALLFSGFAEAQAPAEGASSGSPQHADTSVPASDTSVPSATPPSVTAAETAAAAGPTPIAPSETPSTEPAPARRSLPPRLGPFSITTPAGSLSFGIATQIRVTTTNEGARFGDGGDRENETSIEIRRARIFFRGSFLDDRLITLFHISTSPSSLEILDASLDGRLTRNLSLRVGQFKTPFTFHRFRSFGNLPMTEWDIAAVRFGAERQMGAEVHSLTPREAHVDYSLGVFTGVNARAAFERGVAETYVETMPNPSNLRAAQPPTQFHPEFMGRIGYVSENADPAMLSDPQGGGLRYFAALSAAYDVRPRETLDYAARIAAEAMVKYEHFTANAISYLGFVDPYGDPLELGMIGTTFDVTYRPFQHFEVALRYSRVDTLHRFRQDVRDYVDRIVNEADPAEQAAIANAHANAGMVRHSEEYAVGMNFPIAGRNVIIQTDFAVLRNDRVGRSNDTDGLRLRTQFQLFF